MATQREQYGEEVYRLRTAGWSWNEIAERFPDVPKPSLRRVYSEELKARGEEPLPPSDDDDNEPSDDGSAFEFRMAGNTAVGSAQGGSIRSLEQLLTVIRRNGGDLEPWQVLRHEVTVWEAGRKEKIVDMRWAGGVATGYVKDTGGWTNKANWRVKAIFAPRREYPIEQAIGGLLARLEAHAPHYDPPPPLPPEGEHAYIVNVYDAHYGKRSADGAYTVERAAQDYLAAHKALARRAVASGRHIGEVMIPMGHDLINADSMTGQTTKGTWVEMSADVRDAIDAVCWAAPQAIEIWATIAPVKVYVIPGNHDRLLMHFFGQFLAAHFRNHPHVAVNLDKAEHRYYQWGRVAIGMTHEQVKPERLAMLMPVEAPRLWADTTWREWLTGHLHTRQQAAFMLDEVAGVVMRTIPALCPPDTWHVAQAFVGNHRAAEGLYYHSEYGPAGDDVVFVDELAQ